MLFGTATDEPTSFAILDRYVEAGGTFIDTANNYAYWINGSQGGESEELLGRWRRSRGVGDEIVIATKLGGRPLTPSTTISDNLEGLSAKVIRESVGLLGASNHWAWRLERSRRLAAAAGLPGYEVLQYHHSYLRPRTDLPSRRSPDGDLGVLSGDLLSYLRGELGVALVAYSPLLGGAYVRADKPLGVEFDHAGTPVRLAALREVAKQTGATVNQVVLAWLIGGEIPMIPLVGASSVAQLDESLAAVDLELTVEQRTRLDAAR